MKWLNCKLSLQLIEIVQLAQGYLIYDTYWNVIKNNQEFYIVRIVYYK